MIPLGSRQTMLLHCSRYFDNFLPQIPKHTFLRAYLGGPIETRLNIPIQYKQTIICLQCVTKAIKYHFLMNAEKEYFLMQILIECNVG
jgi:hypothetical protein